MTQHIEIGDVSPRIQYTADGAQTVFTYPFPIFQATDMAVYLDEAVQVTGFTVNGAGASSGGNVTFESAPADGTTVTLRRELAIQRTTDFQEGGEFRAKVINDELDYQTAALQQVEAEAARGIKLSPTDTATSMEIPSKTDRADKQLGFDTNGDLIATDGVPGPTGPAGTDGSDGDDGLFAGTEDIVTIANADKVALLDASDSSAPKYALWSAMKTAIQTFVFGGGSLTGGYTQAIHNLGDLNSATTLHCSDGLFQKATMTGSFTLTAPDDTDEGYVDLLLTIDATGGYTLTLSGFTLIGSTNPDMTANKVNHLRVTKTEGYSLLEVVHVA